MIEVSIVIPIFNEEKNILILYEELKKVLDELGLVYEIICVNDGSRDKSLIVLKDLAVRNDKIKVIDFKINFGQTAALSAGISHARGKIIIPMDADLQNDPVDIPRFLAKITEGYDVVSGWRQGRWQSHIFTRKLPSICANWLISRITKLKLHDYGCTMKAYKRGVIQGVILYGEMHRFIPAYASWHGGRVAELIVNYRERIHGKTNYGMSRMFKVILDLVVVKFLSKYMSRPIHFFGGIGFVSFFLGIITGLTSLVLRIWEIKYITETPLPILSALFIIVGVQLIAMGIIAEMIMRTYYESQNKQPYIIKEKINFK